MVCSELACSGAHRRSLACFSVARASETLPVFWNLQLLLEAHLDCPSNEFAHKAF